MLKEAKTKVSLADECMAKVTHGDGVERSGYAILTDASALPLRNECIDRIGISFDICDLLYMNPKARAYLEEILRVLVPGGILVCIETGHTKNRPLREVLHLYFKHVVPMVGWLVSKQRRLPIFR